MKEALKLKKDLNLEYDDLRFIDTHRHIPKRKGGEYKDDNYELINPVDHMIKHDNYREREEIFEQLKAIVDDRSQVMKLRNKVQNQLLAYKRRTDSLNDFTEKWLFDKLIEFDNELKAREKILQKLIKELSEGDSKESQIVKSALSVRGIGYVTLAYCLTYINIEKARHVSSLWSYVGLDKASHERYIKGESSGGNKTLRTALYIMADSQVKTRGAYRKVYDDYKNRLEQSEKITNSRNTQGKLIECAWKDTKPSHRHGAALRKIMKHFLADYYFIARTIYELPTDPIYAEAKLGMNHKTVNPFERGWIDVKLQK